MIVSNTLPSFTCEVVDTGSTGCSIVCASKTRILTLVAFSGLVLVECVPRCTDGAGIITIADTATSWTHGAESCCVRVVSFLADRTGIGIDLAALKAICD